MVKLPSRLLCFSRFARFLLPVFLPPDGNGSRRLVTRSRFSRSVRLPAFRSHYRRRHFARDWFATMRTLHRVRFVLGQSSHVWPLVAMTGEAWGQKRKARSVCESPSQPPLVAATGAYVCLRCVRCRLGVRPIEKQQSQQERLVRGLGASCAKVIRKRLRRPQSKKQTALRFPRGQRQGHNPRNLSETPTKVSVAVIRIRRHSRTIIRDAIVDNPRPARGYRRDRCHRGVARNDNLRRAASAWTPIWQWNKVRYRADVSSSARRRPSKGRSRPAFSWISVTKVRCSRFHPFAVDVFDVALGFHLFCCLASRGGHHQHGENHKGKRFHVLTFRPSAAGVYGESCHKPPFEKVSGRLR